MSPKFIVLCLIFVYLAQGAPTICDTNTIDRQMKTLYAAFLKSSSEDSSLLAGYVRGGFHDCATATKGKPKSGCNGSLRNEGDARPNARLASTIESVTTKRDELAPCVSYADGFMLAYSAGVKTGAGLSIVSLLVNPSMPRDDAGDDEDDGDERGRIQLPNPTSRNFSNLLEFYTDRKLTLKDLISSNAVAHSIGSVRSRDVDALFPVNNFTAFPARAGPFYTAHLLWRFETNSERDLLGFFTLPSDQTLVSEKSGRDILNTYGRYKVIGPQKAGKKSNQKIRLSWTGKESRVMLLDFQLFSVRMSQLSGRIMTGEDSFDIPTSAFKLRRTSKGWDGSKDLPFTGTDLNQDLNPALSEFKEADKSWSKVGKNFFTETFTKLP